MKRDVARRSVLATFLVVLLVMPATASDYDYRDIGIVGLDFLPQGDGTIAVVARVSVLQSGDFGFHLKMTQYRAG